MGFSESSYNMKFIAIQSYINKQEKISKQKTTKKHTYTPNLKHKAIRERRTQKQISRRKEIIKFRSEINEKEMKETIAKINETKTGSLRR